MHYHPFRTLLLAALCAAGFSSCIRTDIGNTIGSIGKELPKAVPSYRAVGFMNHSVTIYAVSVYHMNGSYYAQLPIAYVPDHRCGLEYVPQFIGEPYVEMSGFDTPGVKTRNDVYTDTELAALPACNYYVKISQENAQFKHYDAPDSHGTRGSLSVNDLEVAEVIASTDFDLTQAVCIGAYHLRQANEIAAMIPARRAWYNYPLIPLQYAAIVGLDVPLSLITMPLTLSYIFVDPLGVDYNIDTTRR